MTRIRDNSKFTGSVPNVKPAAEAQRTSQAKMRADLGKRRTGSVGTKLAALVNKSIR